MASSRQSSCEPLGSRQFGLEMQIPYADHLLCARKSIETRGYSLPAALLSSEYSEHESSTTVKIDILESEKGEDGVSSMPDIVAVLTTNNSSPISKPHLKRKGWCTFTHSFRYTTREQFEVDEAKHLVDSSSGYGWSEDRPMYGWVVGSFGVYNDDSVDSSEYVADRRMRSLFEISGKGKGSVDEVVSSTQHATTTLPVSTSHAPRCSCGCVPNILSMMEMAALRKKAREEAKQKNSRNA